MNVFFLVPTMNWTTQHLAALGKLIDDGPSIRVCLCVCVCMCV